MTGIHKSYYRTAADLGIAFPPPVKYPYLNLCVLISKVIFLLSVSALAVSFIPRPASSEVRVVSSEPDRIERRMNAITEALSYLLEHAKGLPESPNHPEEQSRTCRIAVSKAVLRSGPGKSYSALMAVAEGTELLIDGEQEGWYRVIGPTGTLVWISKEVVHI